MIEDLDLKQNIITKHSMTIIMKKGRKDKINLSIPSVKTIIKQADISQLNKYITIRTKNVIPNFPILLNTYPTVEYPFSTGEVYLSHSSNDKNYIALYTYNTNNSIILTEHFYSTITVTLLYYLESALIIWEVLHLISFVLTFNLIIFFFMLLKNENTTLFNILLFFLITNLFYYDSLAIFYFILDLPQYIIQRRIIISLITAFVQLCAIYPIENYWYRYYFDDCYNKFFILIYTLEIIVTFILLVFALEMDNVYQYKKDKNKMDREIEYDNNCR